MFWTRYFPYSIAFEDYITPLKLDLKEDSADLQIKTLTI